MTADEIFRRLQVLRDTPQKERPFSFTRLELLTGIARGDLITRMAGQKTMQEKTRVKLERAFMLLENGQVRKTKGLRKKGVRYIEIGPDPKPVQKMVPRIRMTAGGPKVEFVPVNPAAMPVLPKILEKW